MTAEKVHGNGLQVKSSVLQGYIDSLYIGNEVLKFSVVVQDRSIDLAVVDLIAIGNNFDVMPESVSIILCIFEDGAPRFAVPYNETTASRTVCIIDSFVVLRIDVERFITERKDRGEDFIILFRKRRRSREMEY